MYLTVDVYIMYNHMFNVISNDLSDKVMFVQRFFGHENCRKFSSDGGDDMYGTPLYTRTLCVYEYVVHT